MNIEKFTNEQVIADVRRRGLTPQDIFSRDDIQHDFDETSEGDVVVPGNLARDALIALRGGDIAEALFLLGRALAEDQTFYAFHGLDEAARRYFRGSP